MRFEAMASLWKHSDVLCTNEDLGQWRLQQHPIYDVSIWIQLFKTMTILRRVDAGGCSDHGSCPFAHIQVLGRDKMAILMLIHKMPPPPTYWVLFPN